MHSHRLTRRGLLGSSALGLGGLLLGGMRPAAAAAQAAAPHRKFVFAYFEGGWDILLGLDPRDPRTTTAAEHGIETGYDMLAANYRSRGLQRMGALSFGPAVPPGMLAHADRCSIINGVTMDTASHEVGRRYFITGQFPRGLAAVGSSLPAEIVARQGDLSPIPNLSAGVEAYATSLPPHASALSANSISDLLVALTPFTQIDPATLAAVEAFQDESPGCQGRRLDRDDLVSTALRSQQRARSYLRAQLASLFDLARTDAEMAALRELYAIDGGAQANSPQVLAFAAAQALKNDVSQCVSVMVGQTLDTHSNWAQDQAPRQETGWSALGALLTDLAQSPAREDPRRSVLDDTTVLVFSEFGRGPTFNNIGGRDHFLGNSCLVAGAGVRHCLTVGRSATVGMMPVHTDLRSGAGIEAPTAAQLADDDVAILTPKNVLATVLASAGMGYEALRTRPIRALLA